MYPHLKHRANKARFTKIATRIRAPLHKEKYTQTNQSTHKNVFYSMECKSSLITFRRIKENNLRS